jgi:activating signal cointegrator 1
VKALTLTQPWATLIAVGAKKIETRSWSTPYRGRIAIHAAKGFTSIGGKRGFQEQCEVPSFRWGLTSAEKPLPLGAIVALADLVDVKMIDMKLRASVLARPTPEIEFGDYESGRFAWFLENVKALPIPIPCVGHLSLWDVPEDLLDSLYEREA